MGYPYLEGLAYREKCGRRLLSIISPNNETNDEFILFQILDLDMNDN
jgi:hypothetical protein